jgi:uncharacterized protein (TIGR03492 family)
MMDGFVVSASQVMDNRQGLTILLLPGSRAPEAYENWQRLLQGASDIICHRTEPVTFLAAAAPSLDLTQLTAALMHYGWQPRDAYHEQNGNLLYIDQGAFVDYVQRADIAIATAGTATEQFVGLGKPVLTLPGNGPQFTLSFARAQARHLGPSITLLQHTNQVYQALSSILNDPEQQEVIYQNGLHRMGPPGAGQRIAEILTKTLLTS